MSSGKLKFSANMRSGKINLTRGYSDIPYPISDLEITYDSSLMDFSPVKNEIGELYNKAFEIHLFLLRNQNLSNKEKINFCKIERNYIKLFLKAIMKKNYI
ncbi:MAG: hypothetical protein EU531_02640 [Promethearchaeota archaeon]|nr:MAG: hypothetical protein EU531_02640 [Candidatus Lokiarchaeota archaeon]